MMNQEAERKKRILSIMMGKKKDLESPEHAPTNDMAGTEDAQSEAHDGISLEGKESEGTTCPNCGTHIDSNLSDKDGGDMEGSSEEEASESPMMEHEEKKGRLFGHPKKGLGIMIGLKK